MSFESLMVHVVDIYRAQPGPGITTSFGDTPYNSGINCLIQPVSAEFAAKTGFNFGRSYNCLLPAGTDIDIGDRVIDQDAKVYQVSASLNRNYGIAVQHLTVILTEEPVQGPDL